MLRYRNEIESLLSTTLEDFNNKIGELADGTDLTLYGLDSIRAVALIVAIENEFKIEVEDEDLIIDNVKSIKKINDIIEKYANRPVATNE